MTTAWRLLIHEDPLEGAWNMALDRAIQLARQEGSAPPTLRLYEWASPTVTIGRFQDVETVDRAYCSTEGIDLVRRHTGGRGVLHDDEVTYSIVAGLEDGIPRGTGASYRLLCGGLAEAYRLLGVDAALTSRARGSGSSSACYLHATQADLSLGLRKLSGSAQVWHGDTVLQHGSFTMSRVIDREGAAFRLTDKECEALADDTATLEAVLGVKPSRGSVRDAVVAGIAAGLGVRVARGELSRGELETAARLHAGMREYTDGCTSIAGSRFG